MTLTLDAALSPAATPAGFGMHVYGLRPAAHHWRWLHAALDPSIRNLNIIAPRDSAKTTWLAEILTQWEIGTNPLHRIFIGSVTDDQASKRLDAIKTVIESSERWREVFPHIEPDYKRGWSGDGLHVLDTRFAYRDWIARVAQFGNLKVPNLMAAGVGSSRVIGSRFTRVRLDDLHDDKNSLTALQRDRVDSWLMQTVSNTVEARGKQLIIGTRWHRDDVPGRLMNNGEWVTIEVKAIDEAGRSYWAEHWSLERLEQKKREIGARHFRANYMNDPSGLSGQIFDGSWFRPLPETLPEFRTVVLGVDLAISEKQNADYTVIATLGFDHDGSMYILDIRRERWSFHRQQQAIIGAAMRAKSLYHRLDRVGIEAVAYQSSAVQELIRTTDDLPILGIAADTDKLSRARLWEVRAQQGLVYADRSSAWWGNFIDEALDFPRGSHDDQIDAVSVGWHAAARPNSFSEIW